MAKYLRSLTEIIEHTDEEILGLTGIRALHPVNEAKSTLQYGIFVDDNNRFIVYIKSSNYRQYKVIIDFLNRIIVNDLVIAEENVSGIAIQCLRLQTENAKRASFENIQLVAYRDDENPIDWYGTKIPWIGYAVWGKFGFQMSEKFRCGFFCQLMKKEVRKERFVHELYDKNTYAQTSKQIWVDKGDSWDGKFELKLSKFSISILNSLN